MNIIKEEGSLDWTCSYFLNSDLSFQGVLNLQTKHSPFFFKFFSIIFDKQLISLLRGSFKSRNKLCMAN